MEYEGGVYLNPAYPYIRTLIADGAAEIVERYEVDGIHFDDYFIPARRNPWMRKPTSCTHRQWKHPSHWRSGAGQM